MLDRCTLLPMKHWSRQQKNQEGVFELKILHSFGEIWVKYLYGTSRIQYFKKNANWPFLSSLWNPSQHPLFSDWLTTLLPHVLSKIDRVSFGLLSPSDQGALHVVCRTYCLFLWHILSFSLILFCPDQKFRVVNFPRMHWIYFANEFFCSVMNFLTFGFAWQFFILIFSPISCDTCFFHHPLPKTFCSWTPTARRVGHRGPPTLSFQTPILRYQYFWKPEFAGFCANSIGPHFSHLLLSLLCCNTIYFF